MMQQQLEQGLETLHIPYSPQQIQQLLDFVGLLQKWNKIYNLTTITEPSQIISHHILDSLSILPYIKGQQILDVGTGAGFPGIPLAIMNSVRNYTLLDSLGKRVRFLTQVTHELGLNHVKLVQSRVEDFSSGQCFDTIIARAFSSVAEFINKTQHLAGEQAQFLAMKGKHPANETEQLAAEFAVKCIQTLQIPGTDLARHLAIIVKTQ